MKLEGMASHYVEGNSIYVDCSECALGGNGNGKCADKRCSQLQKSYCGGCFSGILMYENSKGKFIK